MIHGEDASIIRTQGKLFEKKLVRGPLFVLFTKLNSNEKKYMKTKATTEYNYVR